MADDSTRAVDARDADVRARMAKAVELWTEKLIDKSGRNLLLNYRDLKKGTFSFKSRLEVLDRLLVKRKASLQALAEIGDFDSEERALKETGERLRTIQRKAQENREEKGLETLFLGIGLARWPRPQGRQITGQGDGTSPKFRAPVLLVPVRIETKGSTRSGLVEVKTYGEPQLNEVLLFLLEEDYGLTLDPERFLQEYLTEEDTGSPWALDYRGLWQSLVVRARTKIAGFSVDQEAVIGNFSFAKMAMVHDLRKNKDKVSGNLLLQAMIGIPEAIATLRAGRQSTVVVPEDLDRSPVEDESLVLDADASQRCVIARAAKGESLVVQGPPGTGKSQTIANLIAQTVADGRRVLFVAEKRAALEAVLKRLAGDVGLRHLVLDLHGASVQKTKIFEDLQNTSTRAHQAFPPQNTKRVHEECISSRDELNAHALRVSKKALPTDLNLGELIGAISRVPEDARLRLRRRDENLDRLTPECMQTLHDVLARVGEFPQLFLGTDPSPWNNARIDDGKHAQELIDGCDALDRQLWPAVTEALNHAVAAEMIEGPVSLKDVETFLSCGRRLREFTELYESEVFGEASDLARALAPAKDGMWARFLAMMTDRQYRDAKKRAIACRCVAIQIPDLLSELEQIAKAIEEWRRFQPAGNMPSAEADFEKCSTVWSEAQAELQKLHVSLAAEKFEDLTVSSATKLFSNLFERKRHPRFLAEMPALSEPFEKAGLAPFFDELRRVNKDHKWWDVCLDFVWWQSALEKQETIDAGLANFKATRHDGTVRQFQISDQEMVRLTSHRVRMAHSERLTEAENNHQGQWATLRREFNKKRKQMALRKLFTETKDVLTRLKPCWVASPLSVSLLLDSEGPTFDLVIFDEASQVLPEDAIAAIYRGGQVVVAGDKHQLPPTQFFASRVPENDGADEEEDDGVEADVRTATEGMESLLTALDPVLGETHLDWHYRSEDERLIAFSNTKIYNGRLTTFPGIHIQNAISHHEVEQFPGDDTNSPTAEVQKVADLVFDHMRGRPGESLGVIAMGVTHANRVQAEIDKRVREGDDDEVAALLAGETSRAERFFVKNLETVQGDERDAIILTVGYGKDEQGALPLTFGPLLQSAGYRRLNVAVTRAKRRITAVSAFSHNDIDSTRSQARGVSLLKEYLQFASNGGSLEKDRHEGAVENAFEGAIRDALKEKGVETWAQYGVSRFRIDLVALHPRKKNQPVLAIECDGATYHSTPTARDRDRLREAHLIRLGWRVHRIWSPDWWYNKELVVRRTVEEFNEAVRAYDHRSIRQERPGDSDRQVTEAVPAVGHGLRCERPAVVHRIKKTINDYTDRELIMIRDYVKSDGMSRSITDTVEAMFEELPFGRLGANIRRRLENIATREAGGYETTTTTFEYN